MCVLSGKALGQENGERERERERERYREKITNIDEQITKFGRLST